MVRILFVLIFCSVMIPMVNGQDRFENKTFRFSMQKPTDWEDCPNEELLKNLEKFDLTDDNLERFCKEHNSSILLTSYYKYDPKLHAGLIPTIQVNVRANPAKDFKDFKTLLTGSVNSFKQYFDDFEFDVKPRVVKVSGIKSIYFVGVYTLKTQYGGIMKVRSRTYAIPYGSYFFQLNFTDGQDVENNSKLFRKLIKTVKIELN